jgi:spermidine synthase
VPFYVLIVLIGITMLLYRFPVMVAAALPLLFAAVDMLQSTQSERLFERSFFGVHKIETHENGQFRVLAHGTTMHGAMRIRNADGSPYTGPPKPLMYYHPDGAIAASLVAAPDHPGGRRIGVVGLGAGAHTCNGRPGDRWHYFEIDAAVVRLAREYFRFLGSCGPDTRIVMGDARLTLAREPEGGLDYLLIDAFSSDAIPMHLLTREAIALYMSRLSPQGVLTLHISNRHLELESVVAALARETGLVARIRMDRAVPPNAADELFTALVVTLARSEAPLQALGEPEKWRPLKDRGNTAWSDDYSNIISALWRHYMR